MSNYHDLIQYPQELLQHAMHHAAHGTDFDLKMALICVDNSVEIILREYLGQPASAFTNKAPDYKELKASVNSFFKLVELSKKHKPSGMKSNDIDVVLRYHEIRNLMYHNGAGLSVTQGTVEQYIKIAQNLVKGLFSKDIDIDLNKLFEGYLGVYIKAYKDFETFHRNSLRQRFDGEYAYYWKISLFDFFDKSLSAKFAEIKQFEIFTTSVAFHDIDITSLKQQTNIVTELHSALKKIVKSDKYKDYLEMENPYDAA